MCMHNNVFYPLFFRWAFLFAAHVGAQLKTASSTHSGSSGTSNTLSVQSVRSHFLARGIMRRKAWPTAKLIIIRYGGRFGAFITNLVKRTSTFPHVCLLSFSRSFSSLVTCALFATLLSPATCFLLLTSLGASITLPVLSATRR